MQKTSTPKQADDARVSRRAFITIAAAGSAATLPAVALATGEENPHQSPCPDAELVALGEVYDQAVREWVPAWQMAGFADEDLMRRHPIDQIDDYREWFRIRDKSPVSALEKIAERRRELVDDLRERILSIPAQGIAGMAVKARVVVGETYKLGPAVQCGNVVREDLEWDHELLLDFVIELNKLGLGRENLV